MVGRKVGERRMLTSLCATLMLMMMMIMMLLSSFSLLVLSLCLSLCLSLLLLLLLNTVIVKRRGRIDVLTRLGNVEIPKKLKEMENRQGKIKKKGKGNERAKNERRLK